MKLQALSVIAILWLSHAFALETRCIDGDSDSIFPVTADIPVSGTTDEQCIPELQYSDTGAVTSIKWIEKPEDVSCKFEIIGRYQGREIVDITFKGHQEDFINPNAPFYSKVLAFRVSANVSSPLRPFYILSGDNVRWFEQTFESDKDLPFSLKISKTIPGNGVMWSDYTFVFSEAGVNLKYLSKGGRKMKTKEMTYDVTGKLVETSISDDN